ncbi:SIMPL domain-containing protein, partial [Candidatus Saccharibacteria bacterium]|nr:SIMPL domain-containing protein [Candidatus Saccharibacteria bacterium]
MQIFVEGSASRDVAPDQITASVTFSLKRETYDQALAEGVKSVKEYLQFIEENTDFQASDFKTHAYTIHENFITNHLDAKSFEDL